MLHRLMYLRPTLPHWRLLDPKACGDTLICSYISLLLSLLGAVWTVKLQNGNRLSGICMQLKSVLVFLTTWLYKAYPADISFTKGCKASEGPKHRNSHNMIAFMNRNLSESLDPLTTWHPTTLHWEIPRCNIATSWNGWLAVSTLHAVTTSNYYNWNEIAIYNDLEDVENKEERKDH